MTAVVIYACFSFYSVLCAAFVTDVVIHARKGALHGDDHQYRVLRNRDLVVLQRIRRMDLSEAADRAGTGG